MRGTAWDLSLPTAVCAEKGEASAAPERIHHSNMEKSMSRSSRIPATGKLAAMKSHERKSIRYPRSLQESYSDREGIFAEHREVWAYLRLRADKAVQGEQAALSKPSEAKNH